MKRRLRGHCLLCGLPTRHVYCHGCSWAAEMEPPVERRGDAILPSMKGGVSGTGKSVALAPSKR